ncbi:MAG: hypothetical protein KatS3mg068_0290 [Candidatus Sericytochromatia bacterium]|nr:MAG: hypothetical protein KatS3mg068_0290 [Candidatus Sericytochromatia bacterium]
MLREILVKSLEKHVWVKYILEPSELSVEALYRQALKSLNNGDTEKAISYIILTLEIDNRFIPIQHFAKTMIFSLSDEFIKKRGHIIKEKHKDLNQYINFLCDKEKDLEKEVTIKQNTILNLEENFEKGSSFSKMINKKSFNSQITELKEDIRRINDEISSTKKEISKIIELCNIEEYIKVITLILEIVTFPRKYINMISN